MKHLHQQNAANALSAYERQVANVPNFIKFAYLAIHMIILWQSLDIVASLSDILAPFSIILSTVGVYVHASIQKMAIVCSSLCI